MRLQRLASVKPARKQFNADARRTSQGAGELLLNHGGLGYIARRGVDFGTSLAVQTLEGLSRLAVQQPLELLSLLPDVVPEVGLALWNLTWLSCGPTRVRLKTVRMGESGGGEEWPAATAAVEALWRDNPGEVGDFHDAMAQNMQMLCFSGMCACEAVPAPRGAGVAAVFPVNTLTLRYRRDNAGLLTLWQQQTANANGLGLYSAGFGGFFAPMPMERFFVSRLAALPDEPYGRAPFGAALTPVLECLAFMRDLLLAWHRVGTPKWDVGFDFEMWATLARDVVGLSDPVEIQQYVQARYDDAVKFYSDLNPDDVFFHDIKSKVNAVGSGSDWGQIEPIWKILRQRLIQSLKQLPTLMGIVEGDTETWSRVQWDIFSSGLQAMSSRAASPLVRASELHLRLLGMPCRVEAEFIPAPTVGRLTEAQALALEIANQARIRDEGWQSQESAAMAVTGTAPVSGPPARPVPVAEAGGNR